jgi:hypothetical protein
MITRIIQVFAVVLMGTACYLMFRHYQGGDSCYTCLASDFMTFCANTLIFFTQNMIRNTDQTLEQMRQAQREAYANSGLPAYPPATVGQVHNPPGGTGNSDCTSSTSATPYANTNCFDNNRVA